MSETRADFAIFGSSPLAGLVAGLLADRHRAHVVIVGEAQARYRLPRTLDLSIAPITRPETWALLASVLPDSHKLIGRIGGRNAIRHVDPIFFADGIAAKEALGHFAHMARSFGNILENLPPARLGEGRAAFKVVDAMTINRPAFEPALETWLGASGVRRVVPRGVGFANEGAVELDLEDETLVAGRAILVDDTTIIDHLPAPLWPQRLLRRPSATVLTASDRHLAGPIMVQLDSGTILVQHEEGGMAVTGPGTLGRFSARIAGLLAAGGQIQQVGQVGFEAVATSDGGPMVGPCADNGPIVLAGLGPIGAFIAPALARWLAGEASPEETSWCDARRPDRRGLAPSVADYQGGMEEQLA
jgi:hypothetical protein